MTPDLVKGKREGGTLITILRRQAINKSLSQN